MAAQAPTTTKVDAVVQKIAAQSPAKLTGVDLYWRFALAGAVCCSVTVSFA
jgi:solute carrier family 25 phosphate transporter 3